VATTNARSPIEVPEDWLVEDRDGLGPFVSREVYRLADGTRREWSSRRHRKRNEALRSGSLWWQPHAIGWWVALLFAIGSFLFAIGVVPAYAGAVGGPADAMTFFAGSIFFTSAGYLQFLQAINAPTDAAGASRGPRRWIAWQPGRIDWWACGVQSIGTLFFNLSTFAATRSALDAAQEHRLIWGPDWLGSIAFMIASSLAWFEVCHRWWAVLRRSLSWWIVAMNLAGSIAFLISAFGAYISPETGEIANVPVANLGTFIGAVGFFVGAVLLVPEMRADAASL